MTNRFTPVVRTDEDGSVRPMTVADVFGSALRSAYAEPAPLPADFLQLLAKLEPTGRGH